MTSAFGDRLSLKEGLLPYHFKILGDFLPSQRPLDVIARKRKYEDQSLVLGEEPQPRLRRSVQCFSRSCDMLLPIKWKRIHTSHLATQFRPPLLQSQNLITFRTEETLQDLHFTIHRVINFLYSKQPYLPCASHLSVMMIAQRIYQRGIVKCWQI
jgi:hypothetical protein